MLRHFAADRYHPLPPVQMLSVMLAYVVARQLCGAADACPAVALVVRIEAARLIATTSPAKNLRVCMAMTANFSKEISVLTAVKEKLGRSDHIDFGAYPHPRDRP